MSTESTMTRELAALEDALAGRPVEPDLAELGDLAVALRDERSEPSPAYTAKLDRRASMGFRTCPDCRSRFRNSRAAMAMTRWIRSRSATISPGFAASIT